MKRIALAPQDESEVAVLQLTNAEHAVLHQHARDFVNINNIFGPAGEQRETRVPRPARHQPGGEHNLDDYDSALANLQL